MDCGTRKRLSLHAWYFSWKLYGLILTSKNPSMHISTPDGRTTNFCSLQVGRAETEIRSSVVKGDTEGSWPK